MVSLVEPPSVHSYGVRRGGSHSVYDQSKPATSSHKPQNLQKSSPSSKTVDYQRINMNPCREEAYCSCGGDPQEKRCYHRFHNKAFCVTILSFFFLLVSAMILCYTYVNTDWKVIRAPAAALMGLWLFVFLIMGLVASQLQVIAGGVKDCVKALFFCRCKEVDKDEAENDPMYGNPGLWKHQH